MTITLFYGDYLYEVHATSKGTLLFIQAKRVDSREETVVDINELPVLLQDLIYQKIYREIKKK